MPGRFYFDWNATAPIRNSARQAMANAMDVTGNPSSVHKEGRRARAIIEKARRQVADLCGAEPDRVVFTSGATEAAALALAGKNLLSAPIEHPAVLAWTKPVLPVDAAGRITASQPGASAVQLANSETGHLQDIPAGTRVTDATQALGKIPVRSQLAKADLAIVSAHKMGGPKGAGAVILGPGIELPAQLRGGGQEFSRRSGTENLYGIAGFGAAAEEAGRELAAGMWDEVESLRNKLENMLKDAAGDIVIFAEDAPRLPNTSCFAVPGWKGVTQVMLMDLNGFAVSAGSACSSGKVRSSGTLRAFGAPREAAESAIRASIGPLTGLEAVERFARAWSGELKRARIRTGPGGRMPESQSAQGA